MAYFSGVVLGGPLKRYGVGERGAKRNDVMAAHLHTDKGDACIGG